MTRRERPSGPLRGGLHSRRRESQVAATLKRQGIGAWLALFAMLMIFVGPLISQSMPMDHPMPMGVGMGHEGMSHENMDHGDMAHAGCSDAQRSVVHAGMPGMGGEEGNRLASDVLWEKCGYCSLLFHSPPLTEDACLALFSVPFATAPAVAFLNEAFVASPVFPGARTRAPPFLIA
ncbi:TPA: DUF2946 domain-containing protein [Pseudomonas aeruginosa]|nr:DUF2946 domain-containing protein [Pseudomonas aeruginosa]